MTNPWILLAVVIAFVANGFYWNHQGHQSATTEWTAKIEAERASASQLARQQERASQEKVNAALKVQNDKVVAINSTLRRDIASLRNRPERPGNLPDIPRATCEGANGSELSRPDAEFLTREAARADEISAGLEACYQAIDATRP